MPDYTVRDRETGKVITFRWNAPAPPTDADLAQVFAEARTFRPTETPTSEPVDALDRLVNLLPTIGGAAGGIIGGTGGTVWGLGIGGVPGAFGGAAVGGAGGEGLRQAIQTARGKEAPRQPGAALTEIGQEGGIQALMELGGMGIARAAKGMGRTLLENAVRPPETLLREFPDVMETIVKERLPVGRGILPRTPSGSQQAKALLRESAGTTRQLLADATATGTTFTARDVGLKQIRQLAADIQKQPISGPDLQRLSEMVSTFVREHGGAMTPLAVKDLKRAAQAIAKPVFKAQRAGGGVAADQALGARFNQAIATGAKEALETIQGVAASEARTQGLIGATRAITKAEARRLPAAAEGLSVTAGVIGSMAQPNSGLDDRLRNALVSWAVARGLGSPRSISRMGLKLTAKQAQAAMREVPRLAEAVAQQLNLRPEATTGAK